VHVRFLTHQRKEAGRNRPLWYRASSSGALDQPDHDQQDDRADRRIDDRAYDARQTQAKSRQQEAGDKRAEDADNDIANQTKPTAPYDLPGNPSGNRTDKQENYERFYGHAVLLRATLMAAASLCVSRNTVELFRQTRTQRTREEAKKIQVAGPPGDISTERQRRRARICRVARIQGSDAASHTA